MGALLAEDFHWVPAGRIAGDPAKQLAYLNDNRARVATRIRQLQTGKRLRNSRCRRCGILSNMRLLRRLRTCSKVDLWWLLNQLANFESGRAKPSTNFDE